MMDLKAAIICHDDTTYLGAVVEALGDIESVVFLNRSAWDGADPGDWEAARELALRHGAVVVEGDWANETVHRRYVLEWARERNVRGLLIPDSDEVLSPELLETLQRIHAAEIADVVYCTMDTYWKSPEYLIKPRERLMPAIYLAPATVHHDHIRSFLGTRPLMLSEEHGTLHHLSYAGPNERILRKISTWSHKDELVEGWQRERWEAWDRDRTMRHLHPTHPPAYDHVERTPVPSVLQPAMQAYLAATGGVDPLHPELPPLGNLPKVSVIVPLYGGPEDIDLCLASLAKVKDLLHEVIVVDDCSPDSAPDVVERYAGFVHLHRKERNSGFAATCNLGAELAKGDVLLFLNSDTIVPRSGLVEMLRCLLRSGTIGAVGPISNAVGHAQLFWGDYSTVAGIDLYADDIARRPDPDLEVDMLVGFCLAVRRTAWEEVGPFDERFEVGMFEDNDLCYRLRRAGYRLQIASKAFVHHKMSVSLERHERNVGELLVGNHSRYVEKWRDDLAFGFASHLSGLSEVPITFIEGRKPEKIWPELAVLKEKASLSLCMIVRDEERVLEQCLQSAKPFFSEIIVVDTGSTDRTVEIALAAGAKVERMEWPNSFAAARNKSLELATGKWICWLDADDTLPPLSGEQILRAVLAAEPHIGGFIFPVRFVTDDPTFGTVVDHVKVFRNEPSIRFEGRIHEQILPSIRAAGYDVVRLQAEVLHTGYDTSEAGQAKKRRRDDTLLRLELQDRPNHPFVLFNLGMTAHYNGEHQDAIQWLEQSLQVAGPEESHVRKAYALKAVSHRELGDAAKAREVCEAGIATVGQDPELLFHLAILEGAAGRLPEAAARYEQVLALGRGGYLGSLDMGIFGYKSHHNLAGVFRQMGNVRRAHEHYVMAFEINPRYLPSLIEAFEMHLDIRDLRGAEFVYDLARRQAAPQGLLQSFREALGTLRG